MAKDKEKKIIVDEDWKAEAQKEKEILAAKEDAERQEKEKEKQQPQPELPPADFPSLISMIATQAFFSLGLLRAEEDKEPTINLKLAQYNIDMLGVIEQKTKGNINDDEAKMLESTLHQLRMAFVKVSEKGS